MVRPLVGAYLLRRVVLRDFEFKFDGPGDDGSRPNQHVEVGRELWPEGDAVMPVHVDEVEGASFAVNVAAIAREAGLDEEWRIANWSCEVTFSLSEFSDSPRRVIVHLDPKRDSRLQWLKQARDLGLD